MARKLGDNRYTQIFRKIFLAHYKKGVEEMAFDREEMVGAARELGIALPKNIGDLIYSFRYRTAFPDDMAAKAPAGKHWIIRPAGRGKYAIVAVVPVEIKPNELMAETRIPDATPGVIAMYALNDEQALLAKVRYNRLIDIFTGITCYSLQSHLRTALSVGQVETDELYVGVDKKGAQFVLPVQAKGGRDRLNIVQIEQDFALCEAKFPALICLPIAAQFLGDELIALFRFEKSEGAVKISSEKHYRLVPGEKMTEQDVAEQNRRLD